MAASFLKTDLDEIFSDDVFGNTGGVVWNGVTVEDAIFDDESIEAQMGEGVAEIIPQPRIMGKTADFDGIDTDDPVQVKGETFYVKNWVPDGTGVIEIFLTRDPLT